MPDIVKILLGLAGFGTLASIVMIVLNIVAGKNNAGDDFADDEEDAESFTRSYVREEEAREPIVFTPLGEDEEYGTFKADQAKEESDGNDAAGYEEPETKAEPELTVYKKEEPKAEKKAWITPAVVEYEEPETVSMQEETAVEEPAVQPVVEEKSQVRINPVQPVEEPQVTIRPVQPVEEKPIQPVQEKPVQPIEPSRKVNLDQILTAAAPSYEPAGAEFAAAIIGDIKVSVGNAQHVGTRDQQQDAFAITPLEDRSVVMSHGVMAVVCDGMGGLENGAEAANLGAVSFMQNYLRDNNVGRDSLLSAVTLTNSMVYDTFGDGEIPAGTTLAAASVLPSGLRFVSVGDSHIYLFRRGRIYQINRDHNYFAELMEQVKAGKMTMQEAQTHPERAHLTSYVGLQKLELVDYNTEAVALRAGDRVILCTDGLFKTLSLEEIATVVTESYNYDAQDKLMAALLNKNKRRQDNVTIVVLYCDKV